MIWEHLLRVLAPLIIVSLAGGVVATAIAAMLYRRGGELLITRISAVSFSLSCFATVMSGVLLLVSGVSTIKVLDLHLGLTRGHEFDIVLRLDALAVPFVLMANFLCGIVGAFSRSYLYREPGHHRFFLLTLLFALGMETIFMAGTLEVLFVGWELIGLSSALLISFFFERPATADNALRAFWAYKISDTALLLCSILLASSGVSTELIGSSPHTPLPLTMAGSLVPLLVIIAAIPKSAQVPFSGWLPRAMEGPTPSSAIFYGGLSVHAGFYLILRMQYQFLMPAWFFVAIATIGAITAMYGYMLSQVQSDVKGLLAFNAMMHVGLMFFEVGVGLAPLAVLHFLGHASLRTYQILNSGSLIHENRNLVTGPSRGTWLPEGLRSRLYATAFDLSLRSGSDPASLVSRLERLSRVLSRLEEHYVTALSSGVDTLRGKRKGKHGDTHKHGVGV